MEVSSSQANKMGLRKTLHDLVRTLRASPKVIILAAILASVAAILTSLSREPLFFSHAEIAPTFDEQEWAFLTLSQSLSSELGLSNQGLPQRYARALIVPLILKSRTVSEKVLSGTYTYNIDGQELITDLYAYMKVTNRDAAIIKLKSRIAGFYPDPQTGTTRITVRTKSPELSYQIANNYLDALEECFDRIKGKAIRENLAYIEQKLKENNLSLAENESALKKLREKNRDYESPHDPILQLEQMQLEREIKIHEAMVIALRSQYELAMSDLFSSANRITVVTRPTVPSRFESPDLKKAFFLSLALGLVFAILAIIFLTVRDTIPSESKKKWMGLLYEIKIDSERFIQLVPIHGMHRKAIVIQSSKPTK